MDMPLGETAFTLPQLQLIWEAAFHSDPSLFVVPDHRNQSQRVHCRDFRYTSDGQCASADEIQMKSEALLSSLCDAASDPAQHFRLIDDLFSSVLEIRLTEASAASRHAASHVSKAAALLQRLPPTPLRFDLSYRHAWHGNGPGKLINFLNPGAMEGLESVPEQGSLAPQQFPSANALWERLTVVTKFSTLALRLAILVTDDPEPYRDVWVGIRGFLDFVSQLLDRICLPPEQMSPLLGTLDADCKDIVQAYLWSTWTRCSLLFFWSILNHHLRHGYDDYNLKDLTALRGPRMLLNPAIRGALHGQGNQSAPYMCAWAFNLLKEDRVGLSMDFRHFHRRYRDLHGQKPQRCLWESDHACVGDHPLDCGRFEDRRLVAAEQSVHACGQDTRQRPCRRLVWERESYVSIKGPVAVSTRRSATQNMITYTCATASTMAISHVWSHGHGGRPQTGMNSCLHERFSRIAEQHGCDSYWIDTLCIPDEHQLRNEAIGYINRIFADSKTVLVLDRDLMAIDVSNVTTARLETLFATFIVCDWNVRAWTMLEAMKGSHGLFILCKDESTISLRDMLITLHAEGRVDLISLGLAMRHLLPTTTDSFSRRASRVSMESGGSMLSHRHATRPGDDIVIWSLISNTGQVFYSAKDMWQASIGRTVRSAFLMSRTPRLTTVRGFSWAPETPYIRQPRAGEAPVQDRVSSHLVFEGADSEALRITGRGVEGLWMVYRVVLADESRYKECPVTALQMGENGRMERMVFPGHFVLNPCWRKAVELLNQHPEVALLHPKREGREQAYDFSGGRGQTQGQTFAICVSDDGERWFWKGIESWPRDMHPPPMSMDELLIA